MRHLRNFRRNWGFGQLVRRPAALAAMAFLVSGICARANVLVIDSFTCADTVSLTGSGFFTSGFNACASALGGEREDFIFQSGPSTSTSTMNSNPPAGAITGTFGAGINAAEGMEWSGSTTPIPGGSLPDLDFSGFDAVLVRIKADTAGTLFMNFGPPLGNSLVFSASFAASANYEDVLIPLINPTVLGTGASLSDVTNVGLYLGNCQANGASCGANIGPGGGTWSIQTVEAVTTPEPSGLLLMSFCFLPFLTRTIWRRERLS